MSALRTLSLQLLELANSVFRRVSKEKKADYVCSGPVLSMGLRVEPSFAALLLDTEVDPETVLHLLDNENIGFTLDEFLAPFRRVKDLIFGKNNNQDTSEDAERVKVKIPRAMFEFYSE